MKTQTIGEFLLRRLEEVGVHHLFGVPGDYNLELLQQVEERGRPVWVGNCNELNASYAADGYARMNGLGVVVVTHGVGAMSAMNGIAGAYSEHVPVVCVCGSLPRKAIDRKTMLHHTLAEGSHRDFYRAFAHVTAAQAQLTPANAAAEIDRMITTAWITQCPVYVELPSDIAYLEIQVPRSSLELPSPSSDQERLRACANAVVERLAKAKAPAMLLDLDAARFGAADAVRQLAEKLDIPVATLTSSKATFPEQSPLFAGIYAGAGSPPDLRRTVEGSDCLLAVGYRRLDTNSGVFTDALPADTIWLHAHSADVGPENFQGITLPQLFRAVASGARPRRSPGPQVGRSKRESDDAAPVPADSDPLTQAAYWRELQGFLRRGDVILAEDGTSAAGATGLVLPDGCAFVTQAVWGSIGYTVGALLGTLLAAPKRRHILFVGDGSFQLTAQEVSTMLRHGLEPFIFLINNSGYTVEKTILGKQAKYNNVANWRYAELPKVFGRDANTKSFVVRTVGDLRAVLRGRHQGLVFVESILDAADSPADLVRTGRAMANVDYGPRGPQSRPGAELGSPNVH